MKMMYIIVLRIYKFCKYKRFNGDLEVIFVSDVQFSKYLNSNEKCNVKNIAD